MTSFAAVHYTLSVVLYDRPFASQATYDDAELNEWEFVSAPQHMALAIHPTDGRPRVSYLHHVRPDDHARTYVYNHQSGMPFFKRDRRVRGRLDLVRFMSAKEASIAQSALCAFGSTLTNLPVYGVQTCHEWIAGAIDCLEQKGLLVRGETRWWKSVIGKSPTEIVSAATRCGGSGSMRYAANDAFAFAWNS